MPCLLAVLALASPRVVFAMVWLFTGFFRSIHSGLLLFLGFLFLPLTTMVYTWLTNTGHPVDVVYLVFVVVAALFDLGLLGHGERKRRSRT